MTEEASYIDYESFLDPSFSATSFANGLVLATNNPSDSPLDLSTPLSRVLFDVQEIDTHIDSLTTKSAIPLLTHTKQGTEAGQRIVKEVESQLDSLTAGYQRLEKDVILRWEVADEVRLVTERLWETVKIGRVVTRCLTLGRQLEAQMTEVGGSAGANIASKDHRAMVRASNTILALRQIFAEAGPGQAGDGLDRVRALTTLRNDLAWPAEQTICSRSQQLIRDFSVSGVSSQQGGQNGASISASSFAQTEAIKARTLSALFSLYLLSDGSGGDAFHPNLMLAALTSYVQTALTSSSASLTRALTALPALDRTLMEISARCQNIIALEALLESAQAPTHPPSTSPRESNLLEPLLTSLDTTSLPSHFWRTLASSLVPRVQDIVSRGGLSARTLRSQKDRLRDAIRECVLRGSQAPAGASSLASNHARTWEREVAVVVGAIVGALGR